MDKTLLTRKARFSDNSVIGKHGFLSGLNLSSLSSQIADGWLKYSGALEREKDVARPAGQTSDPLQWPAAWPSLPPHWHSREEGARKTGRLPKLSVTRRPDVREELGNSYISLLAQPRCPGLRPGSGNIKF